MMIVDKNLIKKIIRIEKAEVLKIPENEFVEIFTRDTNAIANGFFTSCETWKSVKTFKIFYPWLEKTMKSGVGQWWNQIFQTIRNHHIPEETFLLKTWKILKIVYAQTEENPKAWNQFVAYTFLKEQKSDQARV